MFCLSSPLGPQPPKGPGAGFLGCSGSPPLAQAFDGERATVVPGRSVVLDKQAPDAVSCVLIRLEPLRGDESAPYLYGASSIAYRLADAGDGIIVSELLQRFALLLSRHLDDGGFDGIVLVIYPKIV